MRALIGVAATALVVAWVGLLLTFAVHGMDHVAAVIHG